MSESSAVNKSELVNLLNRETSKMPWSELQRFFACGDAIYVHESMDLIDTAAEIALDNKDKLSAWMADNLVGNVSDEQAQTWLDEECVVWAVVVAPWVFVQSIKDDK
ncbi:MAG: DUF2288 family protein [Pseudomonadales bacterium]|nr:DUF2288 family protein [Pseudomonadales bacterium]